MNSNCINITFPKKEDNKQRQVGNHSIDSTEITNRHTSIETVELSMASLECIGNGVIIFRMK